MSTVLKISIAVSLLALFVILGISLAGKDDQKKSMILPTEAKIETSMGTITVELLGNDAPKTVENFAKLASEGFYNGTRFHRVIPGFMIQTGDPLSKNLEDQDYWGTGGPEYRFDDEIHANNKNVVGTLAMANAGPNTNGSQFFINVADNNFLDTKHTVFARVTEGMDVVMTISQVETEGPDRPVEEIMVKSIIVR